MQGRIQIVGPNQVHQGETITLSVTGGAKVVYFGIPGSGKPLVAYAVPKDGKVVIPAPQVQPGTVVRISTSIGLDAVVHLVEVIATE